MACVSDQVFAWKMWTKVKNEEQKNEEQKMTHAIGKTWQLRRIDPIWQQQDETKVKFSRRWV
jgi:hypothetical protein